jgi:nucleoside-diphosphate-sugar epimerase
MNQTKQIEFAARENSAEMRSSTEVSNDSSIVAPHERILVTGAVGFIGSRVVAGLVSRGFHNLVCFTRPGGKLSQAADGESQRPETECFQGNLLSREDCENACKGVAVVFHLAAGTGSKSYPEAFLNSVVTTRNLLDACVKSSTVRRFVLVSSFVVYTNRQKTRLLDESCPIEQHPESRGEAYCFAKVKQEEIVREYGENYGIPYVVVRPGSVYGPGQQGITGRVGIGTFGSFLHMGGSNKIPFTYVDNCADAIVLAGLRKGIDGEAFNIVDDDVPTSRQFLRRYKNDVKRFQSFYIPHAVSYSLSYLWEKYSEWSEGQLPPAFNRGHWHANWKKTRYSNKKLKVKLGWTPTVSTTEGLRRYFAGFGRENHA